MVLHVEMVDELHQAARLEAASLAVELPLREQVLGLQMLPGVNQLIQQDTRHKIQDARHKIQDARHKIQDTRHKVHDKRHKT